MGALSSAGVTLSTSGFELSKRKCPLGAGVEVGDRKMRVIREWAETANMGVNGEERAQGQALRASSPNAGGRKVCLQM